MRLVRQLVTESVLLALAGGVGGGIVAVWAADLVVAYFATAVGLELLRPDYLVDWRVFGFIATTAMAAGVLTGLAPALRATRIELARAIGSGGRNAGGPLAGRRLTNGLVVLQVAVSMLLLVCAGLVQSGRKAGAIDFGFRTDDLLVLSVDPLGQGYDREQARALYRDILEDVVALPGVESASWARRAPLSPGPNRGNVFTLDGGTAPEPDAARVSLNYVDSGFFDTVDIPVLRGRGSREEDTAGDRRVALVSERAARQLWPGQDAIGRRIVHGFLGGAPFEVIGVVRDAHMSPTSPFDRPPFVLYPFEFRPPRGRATLHVPTEEPLGAALPAVADTIRRHDPTLAILDAGGMNDVLRSKPMLVIVRLGAALMGSFGLLGLLLAAVGLYGVVSHAVAQRKQEFGITIRPWLHLGGHHPTRARPRRRAVDTWTGARCGRSVRPGTTHRRFSRRRQSGRSRRVRHRRCLAGGRGSARLFRAVTACGEGRPAHDATRWVERVTATRLRDRRAAPPAGDGRACSGSPAAT